MRNNEYQEIASPEESANALFSVFEEKNAVPDEFLQSFLKNTEEEWTHQNGANIVARAWIDSDFKRRLLEDGTAIVYELGYTLPASHKKLIFIENTDDVHNVIVCTLCSCTAFTLMGLAPGWYKDFEYRSRVVREARQVLSEMGTNLPLHTQLKVWDTTADTRYVVLPKRPENTAGWSFEQLKDIVTKESLIGVETINVQGDS